MRHRERGPLLYDYLEETSLGARTGIRRRNVPARVTDPLSVSEHRLSTRYAWWKANFLEGCVEADTSSGVWPVSDLRVGHFFGRPGERICPQGSRPESWPLDVDLLAKRNREHHYFRVRNANESIRLLSLLQSVALSLQITPDWFDPPQGVIPPLLAPPDFCGAHSVALTSFEAERDCFAFLNSWGEQWGDGGLGYLPRALFDKSIIEAWALVGPGCVVPVSARSGVTKLVWKCSLTPELGFMGKRLWTRLAATDWLGRSRSDTANSSMLKRCSSGRTFAARATEELWRRCCGSWRRGWGLDCACGCRSPTARPIIGNRFLRQHACWGWNCTRHRNGGPDT